MVVKDMYASKASTEKHNQNTNATPAGGGQLKEEKLSAEDAFFFRAYEFCSKRSMVERVAR